MGTMKKQRYELDMCNGALASKILMFALPLMASSLLQLLFNAADIIVVGRYAGRASLAAVGSTTALINLLIALFVGLSVGTNVTVARDLGAGQKEGASRAVHTSVALALVSGLCLTVVGVLCARVMLELMGSPEDVIELASLYLRIYFFGMPATMAYNFGSAILRAQGDTRRPLYFLLFAGIVNVLLNLFFVLQLHWGVAGVAVATVVSQYISAALVLNCLIHEQGALRLDPRRLTIDRRVVRRIMQIGLPAGFQSTVFSLSNVVIQSTINSFGSVVMSGSAAASNIEGFVYAAMNAFYQTALTFTGQNYGAGQCKRVDKVLLYCQAFVILTGLVLGNLAYFFGEALVGIYAPGEEEIIRQGVIRLGYVASLYCICGFMDTMVGSLRGLGSSVIPMVVSLVGACGLRLVWVYTVFPLEPTPGNLYVSYPITWAITGFVHLLTFFYVRKRAYAVFGSGGPAYHAVEGSHPDTAALERTAANK